MAVLITVLYSDIVRRTSPNLHGALVYLVSFGFVVTLFGSVFLHEMGHALVSRHYRIKVNSITLEMLGGHTEMAAEADRPKVEAIISLAGPAVSAVLGAIGVALFAMASPHTLFEQFAFQLAAINIIVAVYNALPGLPLDGGRALRAMVWAAKGDKHLASRVAGRAGRVIAVVTGFGGAALFYAGVVNILGVVFGFMIMVVLWMGATRAIQLGTLGSRFHLLKVSALTKKAAKVVTGTPLSEVLRQVKEIHGAGAFVVDSSGRPLSLMMSASVAAVPAERRPWVPVDDVSRTLDADITLEPSWQGEKVVSAMRRHPSTEYAVMSGGEPLGIVRSSDIADVLDPHTGAGPGFANQGPQQPPFTQQ